MRVIVHCRSLKLKHFKAVASNDYMISERQNGLNDVTYKQNNPFQFFIYKSKIDYYDCVHMTSFSLIFIATGKIIRLPTVYIEIFGMK